MTVALCSAAAVIKHEEPKEQFWGWAAGWNGTGGRGEGGGEGQGVGSLANMSLPA